MKTEEQVITDEAKDAKCGFWQVPLNEESHLLASLDVKPDPEKTEVVCQMAPPHDKLGLQRFLGMTNYLSKFIPSYSELTTPLHGLLHHDTDWCWQEHHAAAFSKLKDALTSCSTSILVNQLCCQQMHSHSRTSPPRTLLMKLRTMT